MPEVKVTLVVILCDENDRGKAGKKWKIMGILKLSISLRILTTVVGVRTQNLQWDQSMDPSPLQLILKKSRSLLALELGFRLIMSSHSFGSGVLAASPQTRTTFSLFTKSIPCVTLNLSNTTSKMVDVT